MTLLQSWISLPLRIPVQRTLKFVFSSVNCTTSVRLFPHLYNQDRDASGWHDKKHTKQPAPHLPGVIGRSSMVWFLFFLSSLSLSPGILCHCWELLSPLLNMFLRAFGHRLLSLETVPIQKNLFHILKSPPSWVKRYRISFFLFMC